MKFLILVLENSKKHVFLSVTASIKYNNCFSSSKQKIKKDNGRMTEKENSDRRNDIEWQFLTTETKPPGEALERGRNRL